MKRVTVKFEIKKTDLPKTIEAIAFASDDKISQRSAIDRAKQRAALGLAKEIINNSKMTTEITDRKK